MAEEFRKLAKNPPLDEYGMMPYLDEIVGSYFVMDFNRGWASVKTLLAQCIDI